MSDDFDFDPAAYRKRVSRIAQHVVPNDDAIPTIAPLEDGAADTLNEVAITTRDELGRRVNVISRSRLG